MRVFTHRPAPLVALIAAVAVGAALVAACAGLLDTAMRLDAPPQRLAGADLVVAAGEHATLAADGRAKASTVTLSERPRLAAGVAARVVSVPGVARAVATSAGTAGALAVTVRDGVSISRLKASIAARLHGQHLSVLTGDDRGRAEATGVAAGRLTLILLAGIFGGMALIVMAILLGSIISLSVQQRRRELGLLRAIGATPRQVRRMVVARTMRPATAAAAAGALAGPALGRALWDRIQSGGVVPDVLALRQSVLAVAAGAVAAWLATRLSVGIAARRAGHARLGDALGETETPAEIGKIRMGFAIFAASGAASCATITMFMPPENAAATGGGTALGGAIACALLAPRLADRLAARLRDTARRLAGLPGALAVVNVRARAHQTGALVTPVILVVAIALANFYQQTTQGDAMRSAFLNGLKADAVVTATDGHAITAQVVGAARRAGATSALVTSKGWIEHPVDTAHRSDPRPLVGVDASASAAKVVSGSLSALRGDAVALPQVVAERLDIKIGDRVGLVLGDGAHVRVAVVALLGGASRYAPIVLPPRLLAAHTTDGARRLLVNGDGDVRARLARALGAQPGV